jgi:4-amino-4-deoxy-L-arabinose transferase-like glycosyltransferase
MDRRQKVYLTLIILLAVFFRFYQIATMPGGLFPDEAANGLDINLMQQGHLQPFYERGNGREALFFYMEWASTAMFGKGQWQMHIVSSLVGVLAVLMVYFVAYRLFMTDVFAADANPVRDDDVFRRKKKRAINIGLLSSFLMAVSTWHVVLSRTALRANLTPLFGALTLYFLLRVYQAQSQKAKYWFSILLGTSFALGFYTYIAFRIMAPILFMILAWPLLASIKNHDFGATIKKYWKMFLVFLAAFAVFVSWIADYFYHNFSYFLGRSGQVSVFNQSLYLVNGQQLTSKPSIFVVLAVVWTVLKTAVVGFFTHGDLNWRQNISGYPFLSPLISPFFGIGLVIVSLLGIWYFFAPLKRSKYWKYFLLTGWFWGMLLPEVATAEGIPHGLRSAGAIAPVFIITAWALYEFVRIIVRLHKKLWDYALHYYKDPAWVKESGFIPPRMRVVNFSFQILCACFFVALTLQTYFLYFVYAANSPEYFYSFRADLTPVSQYLVNRCNQSVAAGLGSTKEHTYLVLDGYSVQTTDYLTSDPKGNFSQPCNVPYHQVDPEHAWQLSGLTSADQVVFTQSSMFDTVKFKQYHPNAHLYLEYRNQFNQAVLAVYKIND